MLVMAIPLVRKDFEWPSKPLQTCMQEGFSFYTGDAESRKSGCNLCSSIPQNGHKGFAQIFVADDLKSTGYSGNANRVSGGCLNICL